MCRATWGRCSLMRMPGTAVWISLNGPPLACPGLRSKVSIWLGPPAIHSRMHDRLRRGSFAAVEARALNQPESEPPASAAEVACSQARREQCRSAFAAMSVPCRRALVVVQELRTVEQRPEDVAERALAPGRGCAVVHVLQQTRLLRQPGEPSQGGEEQCLHLASRIEERARCDRAER